MAPNKKTTRFNTPRRVKWKASLRPDTDTSQPVERAEGDEPNADRALIVPGVLATQTEVVHYLSGIGRARVVLDINVELVRGWGLESIAFMKDHGWSVDQVIGRMSNLRVENDELWVDADFDKELGRKYYGPVVRGTYKDLSVSADLHVLMLVEPGDDSKLPLYRAIKWRPVEGSLVWKGADESSGFRRSDMNTEELRALGLSEEQIKRVLAMQPDEPEVIGDDGGAAPATAKREAQSPAPAPALAAAGVDISAISEAVGAAVVRGLAAAGVGNAAATQQAEPKPKPGEPSLETAIRGARALNIPEDVIARNLEQAAGDVGAFSLLSRGHLADNQQVPDVVPRPANGGHERRYEALADMAACLRARCNVASEADLKRIARHDLDPHRATLVGLSTRAAQAWNPSRSVIGESTGMLEMLCKQTMARGLEQAIDVHGMPGMRFVQRDAWGGLVPGDLPATLADVMHKVFMPTYDRASLPYDKLAIRRDVVDRRAHHMVHTDIAGRFDPLAVGENLKPIVIREQDSQFIAHPYGHYHKVDWATLVDDDLGFLQRIPQQFAVWIAGQRVRVFTMAIAEAAYTGSYNIIVPDVRTFRLILEIIREVALAATPIPAGPSEDPRNETGKSYALLPDTMMYANDLRLEWESFAAPAEVDNRADKRTTYEQAMWSQSHEALELPKSSWHAWPGPNSPFCPVVYGEIVGQGLSLRTGPTAPHEQDGLYIRTFSTFGASVIRENTIFRVSQDEGANALAVGRDARGLLELLKHLSPEDLTDLTAEIQGVVQRRKGK